MLPQALPSTLLAEELDALLTGVSAFAAQEILTRAPRPEQALSAGDFRAITAAADAAGLLDNSGQGYGLWSECGRGEAPGFTLRLPAVNDALRAQLDVLRTAMAGKTLRACG